jgi:flotillin
MVGGMFGLYKVVPVNEAVVRILMNKKDIFCSRNGSKSAFWYVPFVTKLHKLPLCNLAIPVSDIKLNDKNMAKFVCDIVCFINIKDINLAVERLTLTDTEEELGFDFVKLSEDLRAIMESIGRTVTTKQPLLDIYMNRQMLDEAITKEVQAVFPKWGIELVDLELKDIKDAPNSTIIADIERKIAAEIRRDADIKVATTNREAEVVKATEEETYRKRQIEKDKNVAIAQQERVKAEQEKIMDANNAQVEASRKLSVGNADVSRETIIKVAEAEKARQQLVAEGKAKQIEVEGFAEASIIKAKKVADAEGTEKLAMAQQKFNDAATSIEVIKATKEIQVAYAIAYQKAFESATINIVAGSTQEVISGGLAGNIKLGGKEGASLQQFVQTFPQMKDVIDKFTAKK